MAICCQSPDHVVRDCPKRLASWYRGITLAELPPLPVPRANAEPNQGDNDMEFTPSAMTLFSLASTRAQSYAAALQRDQQDSSPDNSSQVTPIEPPDLL